MYERMRGMANKATRAVGTVIKKGEDTIGSLTSIGGIEITVDSMDVTTLDSDGGYKESLGTFKDGGEVPLEGFFVADDGGQMALQSSLDSGLAEAYTIEFPTIPAATWTFKGVVTSFKVGDVELDGAINFGATIKVSGKPVLTAGTGGVA
jgi:predicted secreted protein